MRVTLVSAWPDHVDERSTELADGATLLDALVALDVAVDQTDATAIGLWGKSVPLDTVLNDGDRIEQYRPLIADPKLARHRRATKQGYRWQGRTRRAVKKSGTQD